MLVDRFPKTVTAGFFETVNKPNPQVLEYGKKSPAAFFAVHLSWLLKL